MPSFFFQRWDLF